MKKNEYVKDLRGQIKFDPLPIVPRKVDRGESLRDLLTISNI